MIKVVIFDADGVLVNAEMFSVQLARDYGISTETTKPFFTGVFRDCMIGQADLKEVIVPYLQDWGWEKSVDEFLEYWFKAEHQIDEELVEYIQKLRESGIKCYLATNNEKYRIQYLLKEMGFDKCFDKVFASVNLGCKKPSAEFYKKVLEELGILDASSILYWDDSAENIEGAKEVGIKGEVYTNFEDFKVKMANYIVRV